MALVSRASGWLTLLGGGLIWRCVSDIITFVEDMVHRSKWQVNRRMEGTQDGEVLYESVVEGFSTRPQEVKYSSAMSGFIITGIACIPHSSNMDSPEVHIKSGGLNQKEVVIELKNYYNRQWGCRIQIRGCRAKNVFLENVPNPEPNSLMMGNIDDDLLHKIIEEGFGNEGKEIVFWPEEYSVIITGIACLPKNNNMDSPQVQIKSGGVGHKGVKLQLKNKHNREWGCTIEIRGSFDTADLQEKGPDPEQNSLIVGTQDGEVLHSEIVARSTTEPYEISYPCSEENHDSVITGIACLPTDINMDSPESRIKSGGLDCRKVKLVLKNNYNRKWRCRIVIYGHHVSADVEENKFIVGNQSGIELYQVIVEKNSTQPYEIFCSCPTSNHALVITGIACLPANSNMDSPETTIKSGGLHCREVKLELKNRYNRKWGCKVVVYGQAGIADF